MCGNLKAIFVEIILLTILSFKTSMGVPECCPADTYISPKLCSDNKTSINIHCEIGMYLLDPNENDIFSLEANSNTLLVEDVRVPENKFCLGKLKKNGSEISVALVCFSDNAEWTLRKVILVLSIISAIFLLLTIYIYLVLPNLRDLQGKCLLAFMCCLFASYVTLVVINLIQNFSDLVCVTLGTLLYFFMTATFFWNNTIAFNIWRAIRNISDDTTKTCRWAFYILWGFGGPLLMVAVCFTLDHIPSENHIRPNIGETQCWFKGELESWSYFYGPISVLLILNIIMFSQSVWTLWKSYRATNIPKLRSLRYKCLMYLKIFILTGITWVFEVISFATASNKITQKIWFITDCLNASQGITIFLILVVFRQKVKVGLLKKKLFGINWPESWSHKEMQESLTSSLAEEIELGGPKSKMIGEFRK